MFWLLFFSELCEAGYLDFAVCTATSSTTSQTIYKGDEESAGGLTLLYEGVCM